MRTRRSLDMLPLLDVFMVVLFVFATIQENELSQTTAEATELQTALATAQAEARDAKQQADAAAAAVAQAQARLRQAEAARRARAEAEAAAEAAAGDPVRREAVLSKLLDHFTVFEVEIAGRLGVDGMIDNRCCFRDDPLKPDWRPCGSVPPRSEERAQWLDGGAEGLLAALRRTKGGNAMVLVRQDAMATHRVAHHVDALLRERFAEHHVYDEGATTLAIHCESSR